MKAWFGPMLADLLIPRTGYRVRRNLAYGGDARQLLDLYIPTRLKELAPVLLYFYGGSWQSGSKAHYRFLGQAFASKGIVTAVADYRLYPPARFPDFVADGALALRFIHENIASHGGDPSRIFLSGWRNFARRVRGWSATCIPTWSMWRAR